MKRILIVVVAVIIESNGAMPSAEFWARWNRGEYKETGEQSDVSLPRDR